MHTLGQTASPDASSKESERFPRLYLLLECDRPLASSLSISLRGVHELSIGRGGQRQLAEDRSRLQLPDRWLSSSHARLHDSVGRWILHDEYSKNGSRVNGETVRRRELVDGDLLELGRSFFLYRAAADDGMPLVEDLEHPEHPPPVSLNPLLRSELAKAEKIAHTEISMLILGESGSGKEIVAQHLHAESQRKGAFVPVNCGALPAGLVESELFGHKKGAFSGAVDDHRGLVRSAGGGTLFLDEVADLPSAAQATLLRVLQEKEVRPVGSSSSYPVDLRTISATHLDLDARVAEGGFRQDLFARIAGYRMRLPPLRDRPEDIGMLIAFVLRQHLCDSLTISLEAARALLAYSWPLNVRELKACLATASVLCESKRIELEHLPEALRHTQQASSQDQRTSTSDDAQELRAALMLELSQHRGNISAVARSMDKDRKQIQRWVKRFAIDLDRFRGA